MNDAVESYETKTSLNGNFFGPEKWMVGSDISQIGCDICGGIQKSYLYTAGGYWCKKCMLWELNSVVRFYEPLIKSLSKES